MQQIPHTTNNFETFITLAESTFELHDFIEFEITEIVDALPAFKTGGLDGIPANFMKASVSAIAKSLTYLQFIS